VDISESLLCQEIREGSEVAFEKVFRKYYPYLCSYSTQLLGNSSNSEEIVQEVFLRIWQNRKMLDINISLKAYLFRAVHNGCLNFIKHQKVKLNYFSENLMISKSNDFEDSQNFESEEMKEIVNNAIEKLPPERQRIFRMIRLEERKYKEVAEILNISVKTVENQMTKAIQFLKLS
jgi:RNA polymerase sigma-70 factor (family 1)